MKNSGNVRGISAVIVCLTGLFLFMFVWQSKAELQATATDEKSRSDSKNVTVQASKRGNPFVNFDDGRELDLGANAAGTQAVALVSADFDSDGFADVVTADASGSLQLLKGIDPAIFAIDPNRRERANPEPFSAVATGASLGISPDYLFAGDFTADGKQDVLGAVKGGNGVVLVLGDGHGRFSNPVNISVPVNIMAIESGEIGKPDGQADLAISYTNSKGSFLAVYEHPESAFKHKPEIIKLPSAATSITIGNTDEDFYADIAVACGNDLVIVHERGQAYPWDIVKDSGIVRPPAVIDIRKMPFSIESMTVGRFGEKRGTSLALLGRDGNVYQLEPPRKTAASAVKLASENRANLSGVPFLPTDADPGQYATLADQSKVGQTSDAAGTRWSIPTNFVMLASRNISKNATKM